MYHEINEANVNNFKDSSPNGGRAGGFGLSSHPRELGRKKTKNLAVSPAGTEMMMIKWDCSRRLADEIG